MKPETLECGICRGEFLTHYEADKIPICGECEIEEARERIAALERENAALKAERDKLKVDEGIVTKLLDRQTARIEELESVCAAKDRQSDVLQTAYKEWHQECEQMRPVVDAAIAFRRYGHTVKRLQFLARLGEAVDEYEREKAQATK